MPFVLTLRRCSCRLSCVLAACILMAASGNVSAAPLRLTGRTMGTVYAVTIDSESAAAERERLSAAIEAHLAEINGQMSTWDETSEITRFNQSESTDWFSVSEEFAAVVSSAKEVHMRTEGAFDPTVSPLIDLWGFGAERPASEPTEEDVSEALTRVGMSRIEVRAAPPALRKAHPGVQLNLSAIAKGYAVDVIAVMLQESGFPSFVVDIGGETRAGTAKSSGADWRIGIESPTAGLRRDARPPCVVPVVEAAIATSGDYRNFYEKDGVRYSHTIDPETGLPVRNPPASVSVIHSSCMTADALATALMVMGAERGVAFAELQQLSVLFQLMEDDGRVVTRATGKFRTQDEATEDSRTDSWVVYAAAAVFFVVAVLGMAVGVLVSNREIKGSCGGLAAMPGNDGRSICEMCSVPREDCVNEDLRRQMQAAGEGTDAYPPSGTGDQPQGTVQQSASGD